MAHDEEILTEKWKRISREIGDIYEADVILFSGAIENNSADELIRIIKKDKDKDNVLLMLTTRGGSPDAAFRMARCLQKYYKKLIIYIYGRCKSAGTLVAIAANEIILSDYGEFGPLDVQLDKKDELFESASGLDITQALTSLNERTLDYFRDVLIDLRKGSKGQISTKLASQIATDMAIGVYGKIYEQIDPTQLGAIERAINIAFDYGKRLKSDNVKKDALDRLVSGYPSHSFVIDIKEAKELFRSVRTPTELEEELGECISFATRDETVTALIEKLNVLEKHNEQSEHNESAEQSTGKPGEGSGENNQTLATETGTKTRAGPKAVSS